MQRYFWQMPQMALRSNHAINIMTSTCNVKKYIYVLYIHDARRNSLPKTHICRATCRLHGLLREVVGPYTPSSNPSATTTVSALSVGKFQMVVPFPPKQWKIKIAPASLCNAGCASWNCCRGWLSELWADWQRCCSWELGGLEQLWWWKYWTMLVCVWVWCVFDMFGLDQFFGPTKWCGRSISDRKWQPTNQMGCRSWIRSQLDMKNGKNKLFELIHDFSARPSPMGLRRPRWNWVS